MPNAARRTAKGEAGHHCPCDQLVPWLVTEILVAPCRATRLAEDAAAEVAHARAPRVVLLGRNHAPNLGARLLTIRSLFCVSYFVSVRGPSRIADLLFMDACTGWYVCTYGVTYGITFRDGCFSGSSEKRKLRVRRFRLAVTILKRS